jgi:hypothetical protein
MLRLQDQSELSAYLLGTFDFNTTLLLPGSPHLWDPAEPVGQPGVDGWYPNAMRYRCHRVYSSSTNSERTIKTVRFSNGLYHASHFVH